MDEPMTTSIHRLDPAFASPRISSLALAAYPYAARPPAPHTATEIAALVALLRAAKAVTIVIGHGRHGTTRDTADAITDAWASSGGTVSDVVDWPVRAASWLKAARHLVAPHPDAWVIVDNPAGCAQVAARLTEQDDWTATRTFGTASLDSPAAAALTGFGVLTGMRGVTRDGATWRIGHGVLLRDEPTARTM